MALYRNGRWQEALATLERSLAVSRGTTDAFDLFFLAMCHAKLGDADKAKDCLERAVRWTAVQRNLPGQMTEELQAIRAEAEEAIKDPSR